MSIRRHRRWGSLVATAVAALAVAGCTNEETTPVEPGAPLPSPAATAETTPHLLEPTEQMRELAEQQCRDDPDLDEGVVNAVDPADPDQILSSVVVDCDQVR